jgi:Lrp/AsnC family leucine-responsive transcriptional regulator
MTITLDISDRRILIELQANARLTNLELAQRVGISASSCLRRVRFMEEAGLVKGYALVLDPKAAGVPGNAFVQITLDGQRRAFLDAFEADYLVHIAFRDTADLERIHTDVLTRLPHVARLQSTLSLRTIKQGTALPI